MIFIMKPSASLSFIAAVLLLWQLPDGGAAASFAAAGQAVPSSLHPLHAYEVAAAAATMRPRRAQELRQPAVHVLRLQAPIQSTDGGEGNHPTTALTTSQTPQLPPPPPPPPPELNRLPLPAMLAGGLLLFATSVPPPQRQFATQLLQRAEQALRSMELGMGIEAGGIYASSFATTTTTSTTTTTTTTTTTNTSATSTTSTSAAVDDNSGQKSRVTESHNRVEQLVVQFQITGGNAWASGVAYGMRQRRESAAAEDENAAASAAADGGKSSGSSAGNAEKVQLVSLEVANMDAVWNGVSFEVPV